MTSLVKIEDATLDLCGMPRLHCHTDAWWDESVAALDLRCLNQERASAAQFDKIRSEIDLVLRRQGERGSAAAPSLT
jgi:hypothetical protein